MVREIIKDEETLSQLSVAYKKSTYTTLIEDLIDTAIKHQDRCVGLAAIQIGVPTKAFVVKIGDKFQPMLNVNIIKHSTESYIAKEGCLSIDGEREVKRWKSITVIYENLYNKVIKKEFSGFVAEIIQHEYDHTKGILI